VAITLEHEGGATSQVSLCSSVHLERDVAHVEIFSSSGLVSFEASSAYGASTIARVADDFITVARTRRSHHLDVHRGLYLQRLLDDIAGQLGDHVAPTP
jgi:hypothetical protein